MRTHHRGRVDALLLAGGRGVRLQPVTLSIPKPLLPLGDTTMIEVIIRRLSSAGIQRVYVSLGYMRDFVRAYLNGLVGAGSACDFVMEDHPLGTAGSLALLPLDVETVVVHNCDVLSDVAIDRVVDWHIRQGANLTIVSVLHTIELPFGHLVATECGALAQWIEGEQLARRISAGIYVLDRCVIDLIVPGEPIDMPDLVRRAMERGRVIRVFDHDGLWFDVGSFAQLEQAMAALSAESVLA